MGRQKKVPMRKCIGCGQMKPKKELLRIVCADASASDYRLDANGKQNGRGAYLCRSKSCWEKAQKSHALERSFGHAVPDSVREMVALEMSGITEESPPGKSEWTENAVKSPDGKSERAENAAKSPPGAANSPDSKSDR